MGCRPSSQNDQILRHDGRRFGVQLQVPGGGRLKPELQRGCARSEWLGGTRSPRYPLVGRCQARMVARHHGPGTIRGGTDGIQYTAPPASAKGKEERPPVTAHVSQQRDAVSSPPSDPICAQLLSRNVGLNGIAIG